MHHLWRNRETSELADESRTVTQRTEDDLQIKEKPLRNIATAFQDSKKTRLPVLARRDLAGAECVAVIEMPLHGGR